MSNYTNNYNLSEKAKAFSVDSLLGFNVTKEVHKGSYSQETTQENNLSQKKKIKVKLINCQLWSEFYRLDNEMIITKAGRRIFPSLKYEIYNLQKQAYYIIWIDIIPLDEHRYRYAFPSSRWTVAGRCEPPIPNKYLHPDGVADGSHWMSQPVTFDKVKLTNNKDSKQKAQIILNSMHKYQPRLHIQMVDGPTDQIMDSNHSEQFVFPETAFITVTAYQNQQITNLKIKSNPFAKGFRDAIKTRQINNQEAENSLNLSFSSTSDKLYRPYVVSSGQLENLQQPNIFNNHCCMFPLNFYECCNYDLTQQYFSESRSNIWVPNIYCTLSS